MRSVLNQKAEEGANFLAPPAAGCNCQANDDTGPYGLAQERPTFWCGGHHPRLPRCFGGPCLVRGDSNCLPAPCSLATMLLELPEQAARGAPPPPSPMIQRRMRGCCPVHKHVPSHLSLDGVGKAGVKCLAKRHISTHVLKMRASDSRCSKWLNVEKIPQYRRDGTHKSKSVLTQALSVKQKAW